MGESFPIYRDFLMPLQQTIFEQNLAKQEQFLFLPQCFQLYSIIQLSLTELLHICLKKMENLYNWLEFNETLWKTSLTRENVYFITMIWFNDIIQSYCPFNFCIIWHRNIPFHFCPGYFSATPDLNSLKLYGKLH